MKKSCPHLFIVSTVFSSVVKFDVTCLGVYLENEKQTGIALFDRQGRSIKLSLRFPALNVY